MFLQTQMRTAFINAAVKAANRPKPAARSVILRVGSNADVGVGCYQVKPWNAHLSMPTYARLKSMGVMA